MATPQIVERAPSHDSIVEREDEELVAQAADGDRDAYRVLVERYQSRVLRLALEMVKNRHDAEDIVQESFVKAYLALRSFKGESSFYTWLHRIAYNMAIDFRRKNLKHVVNAEEYNDASMVAADQMEIGGRTDANPHSNLFHKERLEKIRGALSGISEEHRAVVVLREVEGMSYEEIADVVGISKGTVMSRLHYARKKLQKTLREFISDDRGSEKLFSSRASGAEEG